MEHILDLAGYDHMLFVVALCALYLVREWRQIIVLITAFTIGHSVTLALSVLDIVKFPSDIIEYLIPTTIFLTAVYNLIQPSQESTRQRRLLSNLMALFFGLIHGMGFSNYLSELLCRDACVTGPLLMFNVGLEVGQLVIVAVAMVLNTLIYLVLEKGLKKPYRWWQLILSSGVALFSLSMMWEAKFW